VGVIVGGAWQAASAVPAPEAVTAGFAVWRERGCEGCHTLYGQGGTYGPDLTQIVAQRGADYLRAFMVNPGAFHPSERVMPRFTLTLLEVDHLIAMLEWADSGSGFADGWPPRPIVVAGMGGLGMMAADGGTTADTGGDPALARGRVIFGQRCASCHSLEPDVIIVGPSMAGVAERAGQRVSDQSAEEYMRNSILNPSDYVVEGFADVMQKNLADVLSSQDVDAVIAYLIGLEVRGS
jgi:nitric oxide reductase subunit C